ncbi:methyltransferase [Halegenticoccus soli]|uniref:methyltransferase n=1 Tax=Halegenticoccus soli TaxID=1985678 RepID=UPI000C6DEEED|nr:methyltransferase [Halegenticoccus soli]
MPTRDRTGLDIEELFLLWAARRSGVLGALTDRAGTPEAVAEQAGVTDRAARATVEALAELGFLARVGDEYELTNRALGFLAKRDVRSIGRLPHALDLFDLWVALPETMATDDPPARPPNWTRNRLGAHAATDDALVRAAVTAAVRARPDAERVADLFGGSGVYAREFAARGFDATLVDDPAVIEIVEPLLARGPVELVAGDPPTLPAAAFDLAFAADACRERSIDGNRKLCAAAFDALAPGGAIVLVDAVRGRSDAATRIAAEALAKGGGGTYGEAEFRAWLADAGFSDVAVRDVPGTDRAAAVGYKHTVD